MNLQVISEEEKITLQTFLHFYLALRRRETNAMWFQKIGAKFSKSSSVLDRKGFPYSLTFKWKLRSFTATKTWRHQLLSDLAKLSQNVSPPNPAHSPLVPRLGVSVLPYPSPAQCPLAAHPMPTRRPSLPSPCQKMASAPISYLWYQDRVG